jgi:hypothetical protein
MIGDEVNIKLDTEIPDNMLIPDGSAGPPLLYLSLCE